MSVQAPKVPDTFAQVKLSHQFYHQNVPALIRMFKLPRDQSRAIVATCPNCQSYQVPSLGTGLNPRGLGSCEIWQKDVT
ncbi:POL1 protein, partial [Callaeas wilsoni]|nr:POL1 protein [Callaeas wilsoni]